MSWLQPTQSDHHFLLDLKSHETDTVLYRLLKVLSPALRIEPLLLRNARLHFVPDSSIELESDVWFGSYIHSRNAKAATLHKGVASVLLKELQEDEQDYKEVLSFIKKQTRHWTAQDKMEQKMRLAAHQQKADELKQDFQTILATIVKLRDAPKQQKDLVRWLRGAMPTLISNETEWNEETRLLYQSIAATINSPEKWHASAHQNTSPIPQWLRDALPETTTNEVGLQMRPGQLEIVTPDASDYKFSTTMPLPTQIYLTFESNNKSRWEPVWLGKKIQIPATLKELHLQTLDGGNWLLKIKSNEEIQLGGDSNNSKDPSNNNNNNNNEIYLAFVKEDIDQAKTIINWFEEKGISVKAFEENSGNNTIRSDITNHQKLIRLWSASARKKWETWETWEEQSEPQIKSILLRIEDIDVPKGNIEVDRLIDWKDLQNKTKSAEILDSLINWSMVTPDAYDSTHSEADPLIAELKKINITPHHRLEIGDRLAEMGDPRPGVSVRDIEIIEYSTEVQTLLDELNDIKTQPPRRLEIGNLLDRMDDPRFGVGLDENGLPEIDWVEVPAGEFIYGEEKSQKTLELDTFYMSRYPVTNRQFQVFIDHKSYDNKSWWMGLKKPEPHESRWEQSNRPKEWVDWYEAIAYTRWLSSTLGVEARLPSEQQWEKAARSTDGRNYPWGNQYLSGYANVDEQKEKDGDWYLKETTAVGVYPHGKSPYDIEDMSGDIWEWCLNNHDNPEIMEENTQSGGRVLRGGSWISYAGYARAARRGGGNPDDRFNYGGFRVVCVLPFTDH